MMKRFKITKVARTLAIAVTATAGILTSCTDYSEFTEAELKYQENLKSYTELFKAKFGDFDPNHGWGMDVPIRCMQSVGSPMMGTRADANPDMADHGLVNVNINEWVNSNTSPAGPYREDALAHDIQIPGWPHLNDLYYGNTGGSALGFAKKASQLTNGDRPCGDITEFEIQYVSTWFRTHKNPESIQLHLSDFFIQNVSADADQVEYRNTQSAGDIKGIAPCTNGENITFATEGVGKNITIKSQGSNERINYSLDQLCFKAIGGSADPNINDNGWTHVNNFNNGNVNWNPEASTNNAYREIKYITSSGTEDFACRSSMNAENTAWIRDWVLVHLQWVETVKDPNSPKFGKAIPREGYYLAFDFSTETPQTKVERDGYYSNWIIKITPGHFTPESGAQRVMCEDLGGTLDFDFNDAVFDVAFDRNGQTIVTVQATGATMPIYIGWDPRDASGNYAPTGVVPQYEIHNLLENVSGPMKQINVKDGTFNTHAPAIFRGRTYANADDRKIGNLNMYVVNNRGTNKDNPHVYRLHSNNYDRIGMDNPEMPEGGNPQTHLGEDQWDVAPRAFAIPATSRWMVEYVGIDEGYPEFAKWCKNPEHKPSTGGEWYESVNDQANGVLYSHTIDKNGLITGEGGGAPAEWINLTIPNDVPSIDYVSSTIKLHAYSGESAIWRTIANEKLADDHQITFTIVMTSDRLPANPFQCIVIPADYNSTTTNITYQGYTAAASSFPTALTRWKDPSYLENTVEVVGKKTYTVSFNFTKAQLYSILHQAGSEDKIADYLLLYLKNGKGNVDSENPTKTSDLKPSDITINKWYVHY